jgi:diguanylate cyclase (GGDEF)-like protein
VRNEIASANERSYGALSRLLADPPLRDRIAWRDPIRAETMISEDRGLLARAFGTLALVGAATGWALLIVGDHGTERNDWAIAALSAAAMVLSAICFVGYRRLPGWFFQLLTATGTLLITAALASGSDGAEGIYALFYLWIAFLAALFFTLRAAVAQIAFAAAAFTAVMASRDATFAVNYVVALTFVLTTSGWIIALLRRRIEQLASDLASEAHTDSLTALANRRGFDERFKLEVARAARTGRPLSLIICDLDRFKMVNDELGHGEGDAALRRAAAAIAASVRSIDAVSRLGGEEFAILLPNASQVEAFVVAERIRMGVLEEFAEHPVPLTASCGFACLDGDRADAQKLFHGADAALYRAKRAGRNCSIAYDSAAALGPSGPAQA